MFSTCDEHHRALKRQGAQYPQKHPFGDSLYLHRVQQTVAKALLGTAPALLQVSSELHCSLRHACFNAIARGVVTARFPPKRRCLTVTV